MYKKNRKLKKTETYLCAVILISLAGIGVGIYFEQYRPNPAVSVTYSIESAAETSEITLKELISVPASMALLTPPEVFKAHNLSDKINGKADLYLSAGFRQLSCQRFNLKNDPPSWLEIFIYDMNNVLNAFSVFSSQRRDDAQPVELSRFSYQTENALFFVHGPFYVEIVASTSSDPLRDIMKLTAEDFVRKHPIQFEAIRELEMFPQQNLDKNSITLISANAFGYERLDRIFTAVYRLEKTDLTVFVSHRKSQPEAEQLAAAYHDFLLAYGGKNLPNLTNITNARLVHIFDGYELIFSEGAYLAGIHETADKAAAETMAEVLNLRLKASGNE